MWRWHRGQELERGIREIGESWRVCDGGPAGPRRRCTATVEIGEGCADWQVADRYLFGLRLDVVVLLQRLGGGGGVVVADLFDAHDHDSFSDQAAKLPGSWWPDYVEWLGERSGELRPARKKLGGGPSRDQLSI